MIAIVDYGVGNIKNVYKAFSNLGLEVKVTSSKIDLDNSRGIILPGVGAFKDAIDNLRDKDLVDCLKINVNKGKMLFGICLGMQLLYDISYEDGQWDGLGLLKGEVDKIECNYKVPHMGWNSLIKAKEDEIGENINNGEYVYFVHSYYAKPKDDKEVVFWTDYGIKIPAIVRKNNIIGMQFHPEKSGKTGEKLLENIKGLIG